MKRIAPFLEVVLHSARLLYKQAGRGLGHNGVAPLALVFEGVTEGVLMQDATVSASHEVSQVLAAPVKALEAALTQNLVGIWATRRRAVAEISHPNMSSPVSPLNIFKVKRGKLGREPFVCCRARPD